ncbi:MAG: PilZ domain-containing protein [Candidatus Krumholzibacteria bacterium]|nr:PilZ domain-containing protein [Candidatus Krumholzibacteria bacterium]
MDFDERRKAQRVEANLAITLSGGPAEEATGKTLNISTNGVYFQSPRFMEPLTKVQLELMIPDPECQDEGESSVTIEGIVVRVDPEKKDAAVSSYHVAVFFTFVTEYAKDILTEYIKRRVFS